MSEVEREQEHQVTPLELFFDLVFVFAITQVTSLLAHDPTWHGVLRGMLVLVALWRRRATQVRVAFVLLALLALQMTIGEIQYRTHLPWWLVLVHVTVAATVWAAVTAFVFSLWRPRRMA